MTWNPSCHGGYFQNADQNHQYSFDTAQVVGDLYSSGHCDDVVQYTHEGISTTR